MIAVVAALLTLVVLGLPLVILLEPRARGGLLLGCSFLLGSGMAALILFALAIAGVRWSILSFSLAVLIPFALAWFWVGRRGGNAMEPIAPESTATRILSAAVDSITGLLLLGHAVFATVAPLGQWDFFAIWGLKARVFSGIGAIDWAFLERPLNEFAHPDYPLLLPLLFDYLSLAQGGWNDRTIGLLFTGFAAALTLVLRDLTFRETGSSLVSALIALALSGIVLRAPLGLGEGPLIAFAAAALLMLRQGLLQPQAGLFRLGTVLLGFAGLTKNEGVALLVAIAAAITMTYGWRRAIGLWPAAVIMATWVIPRAFLGLATDLFTGATWQERVIDHLTNLHELVRALVSHSPGSPLFWVGVLLGIVLVWPRVIGREHFLLLTLAIQMTFYLGSYIVGPHTFDWHVTHSWMRIVSHLAVPFGYLAMISIDRDLRAGVAEATNN